MAKGDIINGLEAVAASASTSFQPAAGVEIVLWFLDYGASASTQGGKGGGLTNGTQKTGFDGLEQLTHQGTNGFRMGITNAIYLSFTNDATAKDFGYSGIQVK